MKSFLSIFSYLFHPIFVPLFGTYFFIVFDAHWLNTTQCELLFLQVAILTFFLPLAFFFGLRLIGKADGIMLSNLSQRKLPLLLHAFLLSVLIYRSITFDHFPLLYLYFLAGIISALLALGLLFVKIKASLHMLGISALTVFIIGLSIKNEINANVLIAFFILINGAVASSRLAMQAHTKKELFYGFLCGSLPIGLLLFLFL